MKSRISRRFVFALVLGSSAALALADDAPSSGAASASSYEFVQSGAGFEPSRHAGFTSRNPSQALRAYFDDRGVTIVPGMEGTPAWSLGLRPVIVDSAGSESALEASAFRARGRRIDYVLADPLGIEAWAVNGEPGLDLGFVLGSDRAEDSSGRAPERRLALVFEGELAAKLSEKSGTLTLYGPAGDPALLAEAVRVVDASGTPLAATLDMLPGAESYARGLVVSLGGSDVAYPLEVSFRIASPFEPSSAVKRARSATGDSQPTSAQQAGTGEFMLLSAPGNDTCSGSQIIPAAGPFPYLTAVTADVTDATTSGDPPLPSCQANVSRSIWYQFTPSVTASYTMSSCAGATGTTATDTVIAVYTSAAACGGPFTQVAGSCDDDSCGPSDFNAVSTVTLEAGTTYYVLVWQFGTTPPAAGQTAVQLRVTQRTLTPPANDQCTGAETIPPAGPFPYLTAVTADVTDATTSGDPPAPSCQANVSRSIWYQFTPSVRANYTLATCADGPTGSTALDTVLAVYTSTGGCGGTFDQVGGYCDDDSCLVEDKQSVISRPLEAGQTYYILVSQFGTTAPASGNTAVQLRVAQGLPPGNDLCGGATSLALNTPVSATSINAFNDYQLSDGACFTGIGQTTSTASGRDMAYAFTAPQAGSYSFRVTNFSTSLNLVLHVAGSCEAGTPPIAVGSCLGAANRAASLVQGTSNSAEEVMCLPLSAGQTVYALVDENAVTAGSSFKIEVTRCDPESPSNGSPAEAGPLSCGLEGTISPAAEADFYSLGTRASGDRVFAIVDGVAANTNDFDLRVTGATDTLEYDDQDVDIPFGTLTPHVAGTPLPAGAAYLKVDHFSSLRVSEPYRLYAVVQPISSTATAEVEPNGTLAQANTGANQYFSGALSSSSDQDWFSFAADAGDLVQLSLDADPLRNATPINAGLALFDSGGGTLVSVNDTNTSSSTASGAGSLTVKTPRSPAEGLVYRISVSGTYAARVTGASAGDYLLSVTRNCKIFPAANVALTQVDTPDPVQVGQPLNYTLTIANSGPAAGRNVVVTDVLPANAAFGAATPSQGSCSGTGPVTCHLGSINSGAQATVGLTVTPSSAGMSSNSASVEADNFDSNLANNSATANTTVQCQPGSGGSGDPTCDGIDDDCDGTVDEDYVSIATSCGVGACSATGVTSCVAGAVQDSCTPGVPSTEICDGADNDCNGATDEGGASLCADGNICTNDSCGGALGCQYVANNAACSDGNACTQVDVCQSGQCVGTTPVICSDGNSCTSDTCNTSTGLCSNPTLPNGTLCNDGNSCTQLDACNAGVCSGSVSSCAPIPAMSSSRSLYLAALIAGIASLALRRRGGGGSR